MMVYGGAHETDTETFSVILPIALLHTTLN
jgi:hypothetical protein